MYGDPRRLRAMAATLEREAGLTRERARLLGSAVQHTRWESSAASAMRARAESLVRALLEVAARYERAADAVLRHAVAVEHEGTRIEAAETEVRHLISRLGREALR